MRFCFEIKIKMILYFIYLNYFKFIDNRNNFKFVMNLIVFYKKKLNILIERRGRSVDRCGEDGWIYIIRDGWGSGECSCRIDLYVGEI